MKSKCLSFYFVFVSLFSMFVTVMVSDAFALRRGGRRIIYSPPPVRHGVILPKLPDSHKAILVGGVKYYHHKGIFYRLTPNGFSVVKAPPKAVVPRLPSGYKTLRVDSIEYYYYGGVCYKKTGSGYLVVEAPPGIVLTDVMPEVVKPKETLDGKVTIVLNVVNIRSGPSSDYPIINQTLKNDILTLCGKTRNWLYIALPGGEKGWVKKNYTAPVEIN